MTMIEPCRCGERKRGKEITVRSNRDDPTKARQYLCENCNLLITISPIGSFIVDLGKLLKGDTDE